MVISLDMYIHPSIHPSIHLSIYLFIYLSNCTYICTYTHPPTHTHTSARTCVYTYIYIYVCMYYIDTYKDEDATNDDPGQWFQIICVVFKIVQRSGMIISRTLHMFRGWLDHQRGQIFRCWNKRGSTLHRGWIGLLGTPALWVWMILKSIFWWVLHDVICLVVIPLMVWQQVVKWDGLTDAETSWFTRLMLLADGCVGPPPNNFGLLFNVQISWVPGVGTSGWST